LQYYLKDLSFILPEHFASALEILPPFDLVTVLSFDEFVLTNPEYSHEPQEIENVEVTNPNSESNKNTYPMCDKATNFIPQ